MHIDVTPIPLSAMQQRMWFLCTSYDGNASPIVALAYRLTGPLDVDRLTNAVHEISMRHAALRVLFVSAASEDPNDCASTLAFSSQTRGSARNHSDLAAVRQRIMPDGLHTEIVEGDEERAREIVAELSGALLDLEHGPLARSVLIRLSDQDYVWCLAVHHILTDGESMALLEREVVALYRGETLPPLAASYAELVSASRDNDVGYWADVLAGVPVLDLPTDLPRPAAKSTRSAHVDHTIDRETTLALERLAREERCTLFMVLLSAYQQMLGECSGQDDICVGVPASGRTSEELEEAFGLFANTLPIRTTFQSGESFSDGLARTRAAVIGALAHQGVPMGRIVAALDLPVDPSRTQVFQTIFSLHTESFTTVRWPDLIATPFLQGNSPQMIHDLVTDIWRTSAGLSVTFRYDAGLFTQDTVVAWAKQYEEFLAWLTSRSSTSPR